MRRFISWKFSFVEYQGWALTLSLIMFAGFIASTIYSLYIIIPDKNQNRTKELIKEKWFNKK